MNCTRLTSIVIPDGVISIGEDAFMNCIRLTSIVIPDSVVYIGEGAFEVCPIPIKVDKGNPAYHNDGNCVIETESKTLIAGWNTSVIPADGSVTRIANQAFGGCTGLTSVVIPDGINSIGVSAFESCFGLTSIVIPDSMTYIGGYAFEECWNLTSITFEGTIEQWNAITKDYEWNYNVPATEVICSDGTVSLK